MDKQSFSKEIYSRFNVVTRARNCFLYTKKGTRLTDMYQENGRAILGWDAKDAYTQFKNTLNRGITGSFITEDKPRIEKAVSKLLNSQRQVFYYSSRTNTMKAALAVAPESSSIYIPWNPYDIKWENIEAVVITPPFPWTDSIYILAVKTGEAAAALEIARTSQIEVPFPVEVGITRAVYNLIQALSERQEKDWFIYDTVVTKYWTRKGPYLYPKMPEEKYNEFIIHCLNCNIVINPDYNQPSIIPFGADKGVFTLLKNNPFNY